MVVGDHQLNTQLLAKLCLLHGGNAAVHCHDQLDTFCVQLSDGNGVQAVALLQSAGDVGHAIRAKAANKVRQQAGCGDAVHIIVAENGDLLPILNGLGDPFGSQVHILKQVGVIKLRLATEIPVSLGKSLLASGRQNHGCQGGIAATDQRIDSLHRRFCHIPNTVFQSITHPIISFSSYYNKNTDIIQ